ncbi:hypothetical protein CLAFUW4_06564 [Fulvia fulva]|uniref:Uncharacterized protein n=1 Tax=Passalora fulva TaxID=5499 RepID=A0A9Q8PBD0_PASFU|nr:uncharacterized protein CLAFUR5_06710 [Fulvia fulva]KAK4621792.1 hypothetical protein CLAFUR4_06572 [Fulvia fulva]KAK4622525.1 hypothetical protein CLAFUR0_06568 [Fulvia fulva]UJO19333.1 hypothetical protein CLAFUR5_06710 [Fulvia fulva]WPV15975.1 hypothetical protein CLAFUW4_06564 [Fulvia fulva]WPV31763.1 hypothetical protein CLAFUW7_06563 [Fulvia fulva]
MVRFLAAESGADFSAQDYMGNTASHYLASYKIVNKKALNFLLSFTEAAKSWATVENEAGYTTADLYELGQLVSEVRELEA